MNSLSVDIYNLEKAGRVHLPGAANVYQQVQSELDSRFSIPADAGYWNQSMADTKGIIKDAENNLRQAGTTLRLIAYSYAATDAEAADRIKKDAGLSELPNLSNGGWSDNTPSGDAGTGPK